MTKIPNMFRKLENQNFVIVSACGELSRVDFEFRASNFSTLCARVNYASYYWDPTLAAQKYFFDNSIVPFTTYIVK